MDYSVYQDDRIVVLKDGISFYQNMFDLEFLYKKDILKYRNKNILLAFNVNGCFGEISNLFYGIHTLKLTEFLFSNTFYVYCFKSDCNCIRYFNELKKIGIKIVMKPGPEDILVETFVPQFTKTGKPKKDKIEEKFNDILEGIINMANKIDLTIMNPPYGKMLPYDIMNKFITERCTDKIIYIGPIGKIYSMIESNDVTNNILLHIEDKTSFTQEEFNKIFNIIQREESGILNIDVNSYFQNKYLRNELYSVYMKIKNVCQKNDIKSIRSYCHCKDNIESDYWFYMQGDGGYCKGWNMKPLDIIVAKTDRAPKLYFPDLKSKKHFKESLDTWVYKIIYLIDKKSAVPAHMPFMADYTKPWTDERFKTYFGINDSEWKIILNSLKDF